jgi:hypothetical protein
VLPAASLASQARPGDPDGGAPPRRTLRDSPALGACGGLSCARAASCDTSRLPSVCGKRSASARGIHIRISEYDLDRRPAPHRAFGAGKHGCAGTYFAAEVIRIGLEELFEAIPNLERDEGHEIDFWGWGFRGPKELHAKWEV